MTASTMCKVCKVYSSNSASSTAWLLRFGLHQNPGPIQRLTSTLDTADRIQALEIYSSCKGNTYVCRTGLVWRSNIKLYAKRTQNSMGKKRLNLYSTTYYVPSLKKDDSIQAISRFDKIFHKKIKDVTHP